MTTVVKVGGSLFDWPELGPRLRAFLHMIDEPLLVPGGGPTVQAIREWDRIHHLGEEASHWLALRTMAANADFLRSLVKASCDVVDAYQFCTDDEANDEHLPHDWSVTSDAVAARIAEVKKAELVLLKSSEPPGATPEEWAATGYVDSYYPNIARRSGLFTRCVNLRTLQVSPRSPERG